MSSDPSIKVEGLGKSYHTYNRPQDRLKQSICPRLQRALRRPPRQYFREFWALRNISFEVGRGETVGIIGRNGSGKSTLLHLICGTLNPSSGTIQTKGRIAALLELGSGFNPEFTGRENIYMNAMLLGLTPAQTDACYDDIVNFADIGDFIDQPVKTYSSGMTIRLAFAVQAQIQPDILIVDEALSVGDAKFQAKCFERLRQLKSNGTSILLVTHSSEQIVAHCSRALLLDHGEQVLIGEPRKVVNRYLDLLFGKDKAVLPTGLSAERRQAEQERGKTGSQPSSGSEPAYRLSKRDDLFTTRPGYNRHEYRWGDGSVAILDFYLGANGKSYPSSIAPSQRIVLAVSVRFLAAVVRPILGITIKTKEGVTIYGTNTEILGDRQFQSAGRPHSSLCAELEFDCRLAGGDYFISIGVAKRHGEDIIPLDRRYDAIHLHVQPGEKDPFFGIADMGLRINAIRETT
ncbi:ABC transporter ATP-binding protein [Pollutimonas sp. H1-120]|uniref:ABC transporter ATP-binding protein n=1 Tax=Pollutimonas sp. H1-120 TaxID=3148824 RepID=UPI003B526315